MIPKVIHYCWFGHNPLPELAQKCIASWKKYCPDYEIIEWNEENFDVHCCPYVEEAYEAKKWAFVTDVARLYVLVQYGGIYMDTDVEVLRPLDCLLEYEAVSGFEDDTHIPTGLMAACKGQPLFVELLHEYDNVHFKAPDESLDLTTNVARITKACAKYGFVPNNQKQTVNGFTLLPRDYLCPKNVVSGELQLTENSIVIHHFDASWWDDETKNANALWLKLRRFFPEDMSRRSAKFISCVKYRGIMAAIKETKKWIAKKKQEGNQ